jgi:erythromycin esterase-like protein
MSVAIAVVSAALAYFFSALITGWLVVNLLASAVAFLAVCYGFLRAMAGVFARGSPRRFAAMASLTAALAVAAVAAAPTLSEKLIPAPDQASESVIEALRANTFPLKTVSAESGFDDLQPLRSVLQDKRIVALGEATHGTREFFKMKHRLLEFLVREMGYEHFGMETSPEAGRVINDYVLGGSQDPRLVLYWPWATAEVMDMIEWMRAYNADPKSTRKITFHGIDPTVGQRDLVMAENVARVLEQAGPESKIVLWAHNAHISNAAGWMGSYLKQAFGDEAYLLGFEFDHGEFTSRMAVIHTYSVGPASPAYYAHGLAKLDDPILFLDFKTMSQNPELRTWLETDQSSHSIAELHAVFRLNPAWHTEYQGWLKLYDGLIFVEQSTPAHDLR